MRITSITLVGALGACVLSVAACGDDTSSTDGSGGGTTTTSATTGSGGSGTTTTTSSTTGTGGGGPSLTCDDYCAEVMAACSGANQQYPDLDHCLAACPSFPAGNLGDTEGDTLGCRIYHGGAAMNDPATHCGHAGPSGGDQDPTDAVAGPCGDACEAFCDLAQMACTGANAQYADQAACITECRTFAPSTGSFDTSDASTNDYNCRLYHLTAATLDPAVHCDHIAADSPVCTQ